jgi:hypothetical protein
MGRRAEVAATKASAPSGRGATVERPDSGGEEEAATLAPGVGSGCCCVDEAGVSAAGGSDWTSSLRGTSAAQVPTAATERLAALASTKAGEVAAGARKLAGRLVSGLAAPSTETTGGSGR